MACASAAGPMYVTNKEVGVSPALCDLRPLGSCFRGCVRRSKVRPWQLMRQTTPVFVWTVGPEERQQKCAVGVVVRRWCCSSHTGNEVSSCVGSVAEGP